MSTSREGSARTLGICLLGALVAVVSGGHADQGLGAGGKQGRWAGRVHPEGHKRCRSGDTIVVRGVHREDVVIRKNGIKLRGDDAVIEAPPRAKADSPCSKTFGPEGYLRRWRRKPRNPQGQGAREGRERYWLHVPGLRG